jgi:signal transduction histidine kinase
MAPGRVDPSFSSGFSSAFAAVYLVAAIYCAWALKRRRAEPGTSAFLVFFVLLTVESTLDGIIFGLGEHAANATLRAVDTFARAASPVALFDAVWSSSHGKQAPPGALRAGGVGVAAMAMVGVPALAPRLADVAAAAFVLGATYVVGKDFTRRRGLGLGPFLGACVLSAALVHDAVVGDRQVTVLGGFGNAAFVLSVFSGAVVRFTLRRDHLSAKTADLATKSEALATQFRELRAAQSELVRREQLAAIGELSAVVAHEVRNPLAVITTAVASLRRSETSEQNREVLLKILSEETERLNQLVGDLLRYAKPLEVERETVNLREVVDKALTPLEARPNVVTRVREAAPVRGIRADPLLIRQAVDNVINNAVQAMPTGGTLTIDLRDVSGAEHGVEIIFNDTGEGMDTAVRRRALDPFFTTRSAGTGLGLAIVARVVDAHGGRLRIFSEPGVGTEVHIFLPENATAPPAGRTRLLPPIIEPFPGAGP